MADMDAKQGISLNGALMRSAFYTLDEQGEPVPAQDGLAWSEWHTREHCQVAETFFGEIRISTVFLGMPHISKEYSREKRAMFFETMVFAEDEATLQRLADLSETDDRGIIATLCGQPEIQKRYATRDEALEGHARLCTFIGICMAKGLLQENNGPDRAD